MKHHYNDQELQAAIDCVLEKVDTNSGSLVSRFHYPNTFKSEAPARLALLKSVLDRLPEPTPPVVDGKTPGQVAYEKRFPVAARRRAWRDLTEVERDEWRHTASAVLAAFGRAEKEYHMPKIPNPLDVQSDILLPTPEQSANANTNAHAEFQAELEAVWNAKTWTPKVGDVVTLRSGGPKMTIGAIHKDEANVFGFKDESLVHAFVPAATLTPA
jgi:hypothetical protein